MLLSCLLALALSTESGGEDVNASDVNVTVGTNILVDDYTNTLLYVVKKTVAEAKENGEVGVVDNAAGTYVVEYVPTLLKIVKAYEVTPEPTPVQELPPATKALKIIIFKPGIMIGCSFGIVFLVGFFYTEFCRRPQHVFVPPAKEVESSSDSSLSSLERRDRTRASDGGKTGKTKTKPGVKKAGSGKSGPTKTGRSLTVKTQGRSTRGTKPKTRRV